MPQNALYLSSRPATALLASGALRVFRQDSQRVQLSALLDLRHTLLMSDLGSSTSYLKESSAITHNCQMISWSTSPSQSKHFQQRQSVELWTWLLCLQTKKSLKSFIQGSTVFLLFFFHKKFPKKNQSWDLTDARCIYQLCGCDTSIHSLIHYVSHIWQIAKECIVPSGWVRLAPDAHSCSSLSYFHSTQSSYAFIMTQHDCASYDMGNFPLNIISHNFIWLELLHEALSHIENKTVYKIKFTESAFFSACFTKREVPGRGEHSCSFFKCRQTRRYCQVEYWLMLRVVYWQAILGSYLKTSGAQRLRPDCGVHFNGFRSIAVIK